MTGAEVAPIALAVIELLKYLRDNSSIDFSDIEKSIDNEVAKKAMLIKLLKA